MYDDTFNPSGIQCGGVHALHEKAFFVALKPPQ